MLDGFLIKAIIAGVGIALITGMTGCFVVWRRMAYFGDSLAHSALLGVALGISLGIGISIGIVAVSVLFAALLFWLEHRGMLATDTLLGILAHGALSTAVVIISFQDVPVDLHAFLFGDILTVTTREIIFLYAGGAVIMAVLARYWSPLVLMTLSPDLARAEGVSTMMMKILFLAMMTIVVAASVRMVGVLLITSMLIIPAATARLFAPSPERMAVLAAATGVIAVLGGISISLETDAPTGPLIVCTLAAMFALSTLFRQRFLR
ncbi:MAG: metal ABC transporter permease [Candidatus Puniceispirillales bacterium]